MFRAALLLYGVLVVGLVLAYLAGGQARYLAWARRLFLFGVGGGVAFFAILLLKRLI